MLVYFDESSQANLYQKKTAKATEGAPPPPDNPAVYPAGTQRAGERLFKITLAGRDAKAKYNEELVQKAGTVKRWCAGGGD